MRLYLYFYSQAWWWECHGLGLHECCWHCGLQFIEGTMNANMYFDILKQSMIPSLQRLGRRAVFQHDNDHCLAKEAYMGHPQTEGGGAQGL